MVLVSHTVHLRHADLNQFEDHIRQTEPHDKCLTRLSQHIVVYNSNECLVLEECYVSGEEMTHHDRKLRSESHSEDANDILSYRLI